MFESVPISRRQFFGRFAGSGEWTEQERQSRITELESRARGALLPYDFTLDPYQTATLFDEIRTRLKAMNDKALHSGELSTVISAIEVSMIQPWREAHEKAEEVRLAASNHITDFLACHTTPEDLQRLRHRFNIPYSTVVEEEVRRHAQQWLDTVSDSRILEYDAASVRELVFSELRSWC